MTVDDRLSDEMFAHLIRIAPLVAIDVVVRNSEDKVLLVLRRHEPAKNYYFVPGGRILKNETLRSAFRRILKEEIGYESELEVARLIGAFDHIYPNNRFEQSGYGTHYVVVAYELLFNEAVKITLDASHSDYRWVGEEMLEKMPNVHPFVKAYFK
jgi:colanic acid biosynthesis protein WcaH